NSYRIVVGQSAYADRNDRNVTIGVAVIGLEGETILTYKSRRRCVNYCVIPIIIFKLTMRRIADNDVGQIVAVDISRRQNYRYCRILLDGDVWRVSNRRIVNRVYSYCNSGSSSGPAIGDSISERI